MIEDDGKGFDKKILATQKGMGLRSIQLVLRNLKEHKH